jgi:Holliday junction resolvase RusA-like endonuclease
MSVTFDVYGTPKPQGSKSAFVANGRAMMKESGGTSFAAWRNAVAEAAMRQAELHGMLDGPLRLNVIFTFRMPGNATAAEKRAGWRWKQSAPDTSKLIRALEDGLQAAGLIRDDSRFADEHAVKYELVDGPTGAHVEITSLVGMAPPVAVPAAQESLL